LAGFDPTIFFSVGGDTIPRRQGTGFNM
jgi:hypothetical protein